MIIAAFTWTYFARLSRGLTVTLRSRPFVDAAVTLGAKRRWFLFREVLPNVLPVVVVYWAVQLPASIVAEATTARARASCTLNVFSSRAARLREYCQVARHAFGWSLSFQTGSARRRRLSTTERPRRGVMVSMVCPAVKTSPVQWKWGGEIPGRFRGAGAEDELQPGLVQRCEIGRGQHHAVGGDDHLDPVEVEVRATDTPRSPARRWSRVHISLRTARNVRAHARVGRSIACSLSLNYIASLPDSMSIPGDMGLSMRFARGERAT